TAERCLEGPHLPWALRSTAQWFADLPCRPYGQHGEHSRDAADREPGGTPRVVARDREQPGYAYTRQQNPRASPAEIDGDGAGRELRSLGVDIACKDGAGDEYHRAPDAGGRAQAQLRDKSPGKARANQ